MIRLGACFFNELAGPAILPTDGQIKINRGRDNTCQKSI